MRNYPETEARPFTDRTASRDRSQVDNAIGAIDSAQQEIGDLLSELEKALGSVLRPEPPTAQGGGAEPREAPTCAMAECLIALNENTRVKARRLRDLIDRIAL